MKVRTILLLVVVCALAAPTFAGPMKAGKYQITVQMQMAGMDAKMPPMTIEKCVTQEEADNPQPPKIKNSDDCKVSDYKLDGKTMTWKVACEKMKATGEGKMTFDGDGWTGESHIKMQDHEMTQTMSGKRVGDCEAKK